MWSKKNVLIFLAGAEAFHTLSHIWLTPSGLLPMTIRSSWFPPFTITREVNAFAIAINGLITIG